MRGTLAGGGCRMGTAVGALGKDGTHDRNPRRSAGRAGRAHPPVRHRGGGRAGRPAGRHGRRPTAGDEGEDPARLIEQPAKVMRIGSMIKQLLEEVRAAPLDEASRRPPQGDPPALDRRAGGRPGAGAARRAGAALAAVQRDVDAERGASCGSRRPSSSAGWRGCSTASRRRWWPSRWRPGCSWSRCAAAGRRCRPAPAGRHPGHAGRQPGRRAAAAAPASTSRPRPDRRAPGRLSSALQVAGDAVVLVAGVTSSAISRHRRVRVAHRHRPPGPGQHRHVVRHVAERHHVARPSTPSRAADQASPAALVTRPRRPRPGPTTTSGSPRPARPGRLPTSAVNSSGSRLAGPDQQLDRRLGEQPRRRDLRPHAAVLGVPARIGYVGSCRISPAVVDLDRERRLRHLVAQPPADLAPAPRAPAGRPAAPRRATGS